jgi:hypothetical protein
LLLRPWTRTASRASWRHADRDAYFEKNVADEAHDIGLRKLGLGEALRFGFYLATRARDRRPIRVYFSPEEIAAMREAYGAESGARLSMNDAVTSAQAMAAEIRRRVDTFAEDHVNLRSSLRFIQENVGARHVWRFVPPSCGARYCLAPSSKLSRAQPVARPSIGSAARRSSIRWPISDG